MPDLVVNADAVLYVVDSPVAGQAPVPRAGHRGETITVSNAEAKRLLAITIDRDYRVGTTYVRQSEPVVYAEGDNPGMGAIEAAKQARAAELRAQLAALEVDSGPAPADAAGDAPRPVTDDPAKSGGKAPAPGGK